MFRARSAAALACFETFDRNHETAAPMSVRTAQAALIQAGMSMSSSSVRCGCRTRSCGVVGTSHLTGEEFPVGGDFEEER